MTLTLEQRNFISVLESRNIEGEHQLPYLKQRFNLTDNQCIQLQNEYWDTIYEEIKQPIKPMTATNKFNTVNNLSRKGEQTINKTAVGFFNNMGQYTDPKTGVKNFDSVTLIYRLILLGLLISAVAWIAKIFLTGSMF